CPVVPPGACKAVSALPNDAIEAASRDTVLLADKSPPPSRPTPAVIVTELFAFAFNAVCVAVDMGLFASDVLSTFDRPTSDLVNVTDDPAFPLTDCTELSARARDARLVLLSANSRVASSVPPPANPSPAITALVLGT